MFTFVIGLCLLVHRPAAASTWTYSAGANGPSNWKDSYSKCDAAVNPRQSPIDINKARMIHDRSLTPFSFNSWDTNPGGTYTITNNGHTAEVDVSSSGMSISGGHLPQGYNLLQFHFHFGSSSTQGSEHTMHGVRYDAEMHFVHINSKYATLTEALDYQDGVLAFAVFLTDTATSDNTAYNDIFNNLGSIKYKDSSNAFSISAFAVGNLIPPISQRTKFYHYRGGLTTPSCNGIVSWYIFDAAVALTRSQLNTFNNMMSTASGATEVAMKDTFRPLQLLDNRIITVSFPSHPGVCAIGGVASMKFGIVSIIIAVLTTLLQL